MSQKTLTDFEEVTLRLKQQLKVVEDKVVADFLGFKPSAWVRRKCRDAFPEKELYALAATRPDLNIDVQYVLTGISTGEKARKSSSVMQTLGKRIKYCRKELGMTQDDMSKKLKTSKRSYCAYESDETPPPEKFLTAFAMLGIDISWLLTGKPASEHQVQVVKDIPIDEHLALQSKYAELLEAQKQQQDEHLALQSKYSELLEAQKQHEKPKKPNFFAKQLQRFIEISMKQWYAPQEINRARAEIEARGWSVQESFSSDGQMLHLVLFKGTQRIGWGMFEPLYCWTEAYQRVTAKPWIDLLSRKQA